MKIQLPILLLFVITLSLSGMVQSQEECASGGQSFESGDVLVVNRGDDQNVREQPTINAPVIQSVPAGEYLTVWGGSECADGYVWWRVEYDRKVGWTAEAASDGSAIWLSKLEMQVYEGYSVRLKYEPSLFSTLEVQDTDWQAHIANYIPPKRIFTLVNYPVTTEDRPKYVGGLPIIDIYPRAEDVDAELNLNTNQSISERFPLKSDALMTFITQAEAREMGYLRPDLAFFAFVDGRASRVVSYYESSGALSPGEYEPVQPYYGYSFTGFTDDGGYYLRAYFPLKVDVTLPDFPVIPTPPAINDSNLSYEEGNQIYRAYVEQVRSLIESLPQQHLPRD